MAAVRPLRNIFIKHSIEEQILSSDSEKTILDVKSYLYNLLYKSYDPHERMYKKELTVITMKSSDDSCHPGLKRRGVNHRVELTTIPMPEKISRAAEIILPGGNNPELWQLAIDNLEQLKKMNPELRQLLPSDLEKLRAVIDYWRNERLKMIYREKSSQTQTFEEFKKDFIVYVVLKKDR